MFPTLSYILEYLFGIHVKLPVQTFGLFMAFSFVGAYHAFKGEFKRKERLGYIRSFIPKKSAGRIGRIFEYIFNAFIGFLLGFKVVGIILDYGAFAWNPLKYIFSFRGHIIGGLIVSEVFIYLTYRKIKIEKRAVADLTHNETHPYQLMTTFTLWCGFWGFIGAKLFSCLENPVTFIHDPLGLIFSFTGWTFYGGLVFGALTYLYIGYQRGMKLIHLADIGSPGMMLAYGIGRLGCHLSGDGDWGIVNTHSKQPLLLWLPDWAWSFHFPHNVLKAGISMNNCLGEYCYVLPQGVFPTSLYEAAICLFLFLMMWLLRNKIRIPGLMFCLYLILNGTERVLMEMIKVNPHYHFGKMSFTQAEMIGFFMTSGGIAGLMIIAWKSRNLIYGVK
jgi:phosphatidylglycerol---prolipoprotein diacylglyceryl transferase